MEISMSERYLVKKLDKPIDWTVEVPGSKSMTNRALLMAALSEGTVEVEGVLFSDDSRHFLSSLASLGFTLNIEESKKKVTVTGCNGSIPKKVAEINVGSAGTAARFLTAMLGFSDGVYTIQASEQMKKRPMKPLFDLLISVGAEITYLEQEGFLPIRIAGCASKKKMHIDGAEHRERDTLSEGTAKDIVAKPLTLNLDISKSTQFLSALLLISPMIKQGLHIHITSEKTDGSYIRITRKMMAEFGVTVAFDGRDYEVTPQVSYQKSSYVVEPDMSAACYFYAAAAVTGGQAMVRHVHMDNTQGDLKFLDVLQQMGCVIEDTKGGIVVKGPAGGELKGIDIDMNDFSDQALTLAAIAPFADRDVSIRNIGHIRGQESDRIHAIVTELARVGILCEEEADAVTIHPGIPTGGIIETYEDHRVAMAFSIIGLKTEGIWIDNPGCCGKTFEEYFEVLDALNADG